MGKPNYNENRKEIRVPDDVKELIKINFKRYKKHEADGFESKKDMKKGYKSYILSRIPNTILWIVSEGWRRKYEEIRYEVYKKIGDPEVIEMITKEIDKNGLESIDYIEYFPIVIMNTIRTMMKAYEVHMKDDPDARPYDPSYMVDLAHLILNKKIKKLKKKGLDEDLAFDILCACPELGTDAEVDLIGTRKDIIRKNNGSVDYEKTYYIGQIFNVIYAYSKEKTLDIDKIFNVIFKERHYFSVIVYALLERKDKYLNYTDTQKEVYNKITTWCFKKMEAMEDRIDVDRIIQAYLITRREDARINRDSARRYILSSIPEEMYPNVVKSVTSVTNIFKQKDENIVNYL